MGSGTLIIMQEMHAGMLKGLELCVQPHLRASKHRLRSW